MPLPYKIFKMGYHIFLFFMLHKTQNVQSFAPEYFPRNRPFQQSSAIFSSSSSSTNFQDIRFLGKGANAIIRPGVILVAPKDEFHHYYRQSTIFIYAMGEDEDFGDTYVIRGAIIDHPTPFTLEEMADSTALQGGIENNPLAGNLIHRGGDKGADSVFMLHNQESIGGGDMIGTSGIFEGGLSDALEACQTGKAKAEDFKFYFNFCQFTELELQSMLEDEPWMSVEIPSNMVLSTEWDRGDCWRQLRNSLRDHIDD